MLSSSLVDCSDRILLFSPNDSFARALWENEILNEIMKIIGNTCDARREYAPRINTLAVEIEKVIMKFVFAP